MKAYAAALGGFSRVFPKSNIMAITVVIIISVIIMFKIVLTIAIIEGIIFYNRNPVALPKSFWV